MLVSEILERKGYEVITASPDASVAELTRLLDDHRIGAALVVSADRILGVVSERDVIRALAAHGPPALTLAVAEIMSRDLEVCAPDDAIDEIMARMTTHRIRHVPVVDGRRLVGLISIGDVVKHRVEEITAETHMLRDYVEMR